MNLTPAQGKLVERHGKLVPLTLRSVFGMSLSIERKEEMLAEGNLALCRAAASFDEGRGIKFTTYAIAMIRGKFLEVSRCTDSRGLPTAAKRGMGLLQQIPIDLTESSDAEIAQLSQGRLKASDVARLRRILSLDNSLSLDSDLESGRHELVSGKSFDDEMAVHLSLRQVVAGASLSERESTVFWRRWDAATFKEISLELGVSESRAYQIHDRAQLKLKNAAMQLGVTPEAMAR